MSDLRALTVRQPWAWAIVHGGKPVENRTWEMKYRGPLWLHAGARSRWDATAAGGSTILRAAWREWAATLPPPNAAGPLRRDSLFVPFGAVVALTEVTGCHYAYSPECKRIHRGNALGRFMCSEWAASGQFHIELTVLQGLRTPVPCRGALGLWRLPDDVAAQVRAQLETTADV